MSPIPPKGSIPGRKPRGRANSDMGLGNLLGGFGGLFEGILKSLGKTIESIQNLNLEDLEKLAEAQGNEEAKENIKELKEKLGKMEGKGINLGDLFGQGFDLSKLIDFAAKHGGEFSQEFAGGKGIVRGGLRGHIFGKPFGGDLPLDRRGPQETKFEVKGTRSRPASKTEKPALEKVEVQEPEMEVYPEEKHIKVIGEMPGVEEENIICEVKEKGTILSISAEGLYRGKVGSEGRKRYAKEVELPSPVTKKATWSYKNGVLEVTLNKRKAS